MLHELRVRRLGVIEDQTLLLGPGLTALTGETGAGKTLIVEALGLLLGGRPDPALVGPGAGEATVEGRFGPPPGAVAAASVPDGNDHGAGEQDGDGEAILGRVVAAAGRSRAYVNGHMASAATLAEVGRDLVDLHGQHAYQSLLSPAMQRAALDAAGAVDRSRVDQARRELRHLAERQAALGGDARARAREIDLLRFQIDELDAAGVEDPDEDTALRDEEERLADAVALRAALTEAYEAIAGDGGAIDRLAGAIGALAGRRPLAAVHDRLRALAAELADGADDARHLADEVEEDPARLAEIGSRRHLLRELRRKYGDTLSEVIGYRVETAARLAELESHEATAAALEGERIRLEAERATAEAELGARRRAAAGPFSAAVEARLRELALPRARFEIEISGDPAGDTVTWHLGANPGQPLLPLTKVASGGELARTMLAVRLVLSGAPATGADGAAPASPAAPTSPAAPGSPIETWGRTLIFDEVDAGIGGEAAVAVGRALATLAAHHQVLVVTHLPQVAAFADQQVVVTKTVEATGAGDRTVARVRAVEGHERVAELSRMLSGQPESVTGRRHAEELLAAAREPSEPRRPVPGGRRTAR
jgi:DNA repair protein RecN (Recombination protein N)